MTESNKEQHRFWVKVVEEVINAWEALEGGKEYNVKIVEKWLMNDMKPMIDKLRVIVKESQNEILH